MTDADRLDHYEQALQAIVEMADVFPGEPLTIGEAAQMLGNSLRVQQGIDNPFDPVTFLTRVIATISNIARDALDTENKP